VVKTDLQRLIAWAAWRVDVSAVLFDEAR